MISEKDYIHKTDYVFDSDRLYSEYKELVKEYNLKGKTQISLTGFSENDTWDCSVGGAKNLTYPELCYHETLKPLKNSYFEKCIKDFPSFYRWRILILEPRSCYSIHRDYDYSNGINTPAINIRVHLPIVTNPDSYLCFFNFPLRPLSNNTIPEGMQSVYYAQLKGNTAYTVCTTHLHTAINHGTIPRIHLVGVSGPPISNFDEIPDVLKTYR